MNIGKISNTAFKGAYIVAGYGRDTVDAKEKLGELQDKKYHEINSKMQIDDIGFGYLEDEVPAYFLVTTGKDVERYNEFTKSRDMYYDIAASEFPNDYVKPEYFDSDEEYAKAVVRNEANVAIEAISRFCKFVNHKKPELIGAKAVLNAIDQDTFNYADGSISR